MKACFLLQRRFAPVGHKLAVILKEKYGVENFCGYVYLRSSFKFLKNQKEIKYTSLLLDEDLHERYLDEKLDFDFPQKKKILELMKNIEEERNALCYGSRKPASRIEKIVFYFNELRNILNKEMGK